MISPPGRQVGSGSHTIPQANYLLDKFTGWGNYIITLNETMCLRAFRLNMDNDSPIC